MDGIDIVRVSVGDTRDADLGKYFDTIADKVRTSID
jgi:hypothetical protein